MRTITTKTKVYKLAELTPEAQEKAREKWDEHSDFSSGSEYLDSLKALAEHFGARLVDYNISWDRGSYSDAKFNVPSDEGEGEPMTRAEIRRRLLALGGFNRRTLKGHGDCKLTGVCTDEDTIDGLRWAFYREEETDVEALLQAAFKSMLKAGQEECEYQSSMEAFKEACEANDYEFTEDGRMFR